MQINRKTGLVGTETMKAEESFNNYKIFLER
jgi:hypothetical protein